MKAIALISGGLDSILATKLIQSQGIEVTGLNFVTPFGKRDQKTNPAIFHLGIEIKTIDISKELLEIIKSPRYGFGSNLNPCIDCKILMLQKAKELRPKLDANFIITGEVLGQRPMSQNKQTLELIEKRSDLEGLLLRPLSAKLLKETIPEKEGWISRDKLLDFSGRSRRPQIALAEKLKIKDYPQPAGGCLLTDPEFSKRLKDLIKHEDLNADNVELLKLGRHFRLNPEAKLIVGRNEKENEKLLGLAKEKDYLFAPPEELSGPLALGKGKFAQNLIRLSCGIVSRYCDLNGKSEVDIIYHLKKDHKEIIHVARIEENELIKLRL